MYDREKRQLLQGSIDSDRSAVATYKLLLVVKRGRFWLSAPYGRVKGRASTAPVCGLRTVVTYASVLDAWPKVIWAC